MKEINVVIIGIILITTITFSGCLDKEYQIVSGKIVNVDYSAGGMGHESITVYYFEDGRVISVYDDHTNIILNKSVILHLWRINGYGDTWHLDSLEYAENTTEVQP